MAVRRLGFDPADWQARMELRVQVVRDMDKAPAKGKTRQLRGGQIADEARKEVR